VQAHWLLGDAELSRLEGGPRPELWTDIAARFDCLGSPYPAAYARLREAQARLATGERVEATAALRVANATLDGLGAAALRSQAQALARRARITLTPPAAHTTSERPFDLTDRELTVLALLASGHTNRRIADELFLSTRTVDSTCATSSESSMRPTACRPLPPPTAPGSPNAPEACRDGAGSRAKGASGCDTACDRTPAPRGRTGH
jgi:hypothetical protein